MKTGKIIQVMGPVVDVEFEDEELPAIRDALEVQNGDKKCIMEVAQHIGNNTDTLLLAHLLLCTLFCFAGSCHIDFLRTLCSLHEKCHTVIDDLDKSHSDNCIFPVIRAFRLKPHLALINGNDHILMMSQNFFLPIIFRNDQRTASSGKEHTVCRYNF